MIYLRLEQSTRKYDISFVSFKKYLAEKAIHTYSLTIDKEGEKGNTVKAAERVGLFPVTEADSLTSCGIRMGGFLSRGHFQIA